MSHYCALIDKIMAQKIMPHKIMPHKIMVHKIMPHPIYVLNETTKSTDNKLVINHVYHITQHCYTCFVAMTRLVT